MIYSKLLQTQIPITINKSRYYVPLYDEQVTRYNVMDKNTQVGYVDLSDTYNGVHVNMIENERPKLYSGFGKVADQLEVEHCLAKGLSVNDIEIISEAAFNSHALHFLRGKRFLQDKFNEVVANVINSTPKGEMFHTEFLGIVQMYMPKELIRKYIELINKHPLIFK